MERRWCYEWWMGGWFRLVTGELRGVRWGGGVFLQTMRMTDANMTHDFDVCKRVMERLQTLFVCTWAVTSALILSKLSISRRRTFVTAHHGRVQIRLEDPVRMQVLASLLSWIISKMVGRRKGRGRCNHNTKDCFKNNGQQVVNTAVDLFSPGAGKGGEWNYEEVKEGTV